MARGSAVGEYSQRSVMSRILVIEDSSEVQERIIASLTFEAFDVVDAKTEGPASEWRASPGPV